jgi:large subunit ribosomal protein L19
MNANRKEEDDMNDILKTIENEQLRTDLARPEVGNHVRVHLNVVEGNRKRVQVFEGTVIALKGSGLKETFTVRRVSYGVGVEKVLPLHSPKINKIEIVRKGKVRRAKLFHLRDRIGKSARVKEKLANKQ